MSLIIAFLMVISIQWLEAQTPDTSGFIDEIVKKDTIVGWSEQPIDSLLLRNIDTKFKKELFQLIIKNEVDTRKTPVENTTMAAMDGRTIRKISFDHVDIFAPAVTDTSYKPVGWFEKTANLTHNDTRNSLLQRYLLIHPGEKLDVFLAAENERILRDLSFIMDAEFIPLPVKGSPDSVDLILLIQDKFPIGIEADIENSSIAVFGISHQNMLGYGHNFSFSSLIDAANKPHFGYRVTYGASNIAKTLTSGRVEYTDKWNQETFGLDLSREFRSISIRNAGGISFEKSRLFKNIDLLDTLFQDKDIEFRSTDIWAGRVILPLKYSTRQMRSALFLSGRLNWYKSIVAPQIDEIYLHPFHDKTLLLFSAGISRQGYRKDNLIYTFGRTEDVPFGYLFDIVAGAEWGMNLTRPYLSLGAARGIYFNNSSYLSWHFRYGTYFAKGKTEQGALAGRIQYFSRLYSHSRFLYRNFLGLSYLYGINRNSGEFLSIGNKGGILGLTSPSMRGHDKIVMNLESVIFSPYVVLGFRFAFFGGLDIGIVKKDGIKISDAGLFSGINMGVRIRNDQLVFETFMIKFSFYPGMPKDGSAQYFMIDNVPRTRFNDLFPDKPSVVQYQ